MTESAAETTPFLDLLDELPQLRPFPEVATRLMRVCEDPDSSARDVREVLQCDPAICLRLLRVANSSMYGYAGNIRTVDQAVVVLGFSAVKNLALSVAAADVFASGASSAVARNDLWKHSLACATIARVLAGHSKQVSPDEAFLAGIVHDVGKLIFWDLAPVDYETLSAQADSTTLVALESTTFGITHQQVGCRCAEDWGLPEDIRQAISFHHSPESAEYSESLVELISVANSLTRSWSIGTKSRPVEAPADAMARVNLSLNCDQMESARQRIMHDYESILSACAV